MCHINIAHISQYLCHTGLTWIFGFLAIEDARLVFQYLFCITATLQSFTILIMAAGDPQVRQHWLQRVCCCLQRWTTAQSVSLPSTCSRHEFYLRRHYRIKWLQHWNENSGHQHEFYLRRHYRLGRQWCASRQIVSP
ncbi:adhesion G-protein coupled receptor g2 [Plakobranchus ocellatus]|uniref:Adhesion G-protein coupled receptor g2 n=1 Tax=Plakobranchus ocellatus TaxID=259542 RepID=A0AAV4DFQ9_9GAST|nr:adhesion G-protein coupled receptor g2 [Plakobranchus ocellatus]